MPACAGMTNWMASSRHNPPVATSRVAARGASLRTWSASSGPTGRYGAQAAAYTIDVTPTQTVIYTHRPSPDAGSALHH